MRNRVFNESKTKWEQDTPFENEYMSVFLSIISHLPGKPLRNSAFWGSVTSVLTGVSPKHSRLQEPCVHPAFRAKEVQGWQTHTFLKRNWKIHTFVLKIQILEWSLVFSTASGREKAAGVDGRLHCERWVIHGPAQPCCSAVKSYEFELSSQMRPRWGLGWLEAGLVPAYAGSLCPSWETLIICRTLTGTTGTLNVGWKRKRQNLKGFSCQPKQVSFLQREEAGSQQGPRDLNSQ